MLSSTAASELPREELSSWGCFWDWGKPHTSSTWSCCGVLLSPTITALHTLRLELTGALVSSSGHLQMSSLQLELTLSFSVDVQWPGSWSAAPVSHWCPQCSPNINLQTLQCSYGLLEEGTSLYSFSCAPLPNEPFLLILWLPRAGWKHQDTHWREEKQ